MRNATELMVQYAAYHRDRRNIATHFVGIPLIVFGLGVLLARPSFPVGSWVLTPAWIAWTAGTLWYLTRGIFTLGAATSLIAFVLFAMAQQVAGGSVASWLTWAIAATILGWIVQFVGHYYEGRKPAFVDDLVGLMVGPMFVTAELLFALGWGRGLLEEIERQVGPTHLRDVAHPV
jgi:uncharacterized membrane protein YGL010W